MKHIHDIYDPGARPYRVLHCIDNLGKGGSETQLVQTLRYMDSNRFENYVCYLYPPSELEETIVRSGVPVINLNIGRSRNWWRAIQGLRKLARQYQIDLIHASTSYSNIYAPLVGVIERIPVVFTLNTTYDARDYIRAKPSFLRKWRVRQFFFLRSLVLRATRTKIIAVSNTTRNSAIKHLGIPAKRIDVVYRGLNPEDFEPGRFSTDSIQRVRQALNIANAYPVLINVGRLWWEKGQKDLIRAMPFVLSNYPQARLLIAGIGPLSIELESLRDKLGLTDCVNLLGKRDDIPLLLSLSHIYVGASYLEGFGNAVVEAMAAGRPVVAYDIPAFNELLKGEAGILVKSRNHQLLAAEIVRLADDPEKMRVIGSRGVQIVRDNFDIRCNTKQLEVLYENIMNGANT
jgi:glycosyltransferase involved in cell wall biosynthesis